MSRGIGLLVALWWTLSPLKAEEVLPITRVVLFRSGVGYIERSGVVEGQATLALNFKTEQVNDLLKSLVLQDLDGGRILPVTYAPREPLARILRSFAIDLSDNPTLATLLNRLRGVPIEVRMASGLLSGRVVGVEERTMANPEGSALTSLHFLHLATENGVETVPLEQIQRLEIRDERLRGEFQQALMALAQGLDNTRKPVRLEFEGEGRRRVRIGYIVEMPVWKMSYRLVLEEGKKPFLQGWAIVENTSEEDWVNVSLSLVSGQPISFIQDLYEPLYAPRPEVKPPLYAFLRPRIYEGELEKAQEERQGAEAAPPAPGAAGALPQDRARRALQEALRAGAGQAAPMALGGTLGGAGVIAMAEAQGLGALFEYRIDRPLTLPRQQSALIPIVNEEVEGWEVSVYNPDVHPRFPLFGLRLKNTTGLTLMGGPLTVFARGAYGGDALIEDIEPGGQRLLTYALDLKVEGNREVKAPAQAIQALKIVRGVLVETRKVRTIQTYTLRNRDTVPRVVLVEHPVRAGWELVEPKEPQERTAQHYRLRVEVPAGETKKVEVVEEQQQQQTVALRQATLENLTLYLKAPAASEALKAALQEVMRRQREIARLEGEIRQRQDQQSEIDKDQARIRENMLRLDRTAELYQRYVRKLDEQESELERLRSEVKELQSRLDAQRQALEEYLASLTVE